MNMRRLLPFGNAHKSLLHFKSTGKPLENIFFDGKGKTQDPVTAVLILCLNIMDFFLVFGGGGGGGSSG